MKIAEVILREGYELRLERDKRANMLVLHVKDTRTGRRSEVRGKLGYETDGYDPNDKLHQLLDKVGRSASVSDMMNGDVVHINPRHPQGPSAKKAASAITSEKIQEAFDNPYPITWEYLKPTGASSAIAKLDDGSALDIHISEDPAGIYEIEFARGSSKKNMGRSGQGDEFRIFATVQAAMSKWWQQLDKTSVKKITFYANKEDGNRARLYKRFLKMWGTKSEWEIDVNANAKPGLVAYTLTNPNPDKPKNGKKTFIQRVFGKKETVENFADGKKKGIGKYLYHVTYASGLLGMLKDGHLNTKGPSGFADYFSMTADPKYVVSGNPEVQIVIDAGRVSQLETFEQHKEDWDDSGKDNGDWESEYRVEETIPWNYVVAVKILKAKATPEIIELAKKRGVKLVGKDTSVTENFADGKKKGKSRPGRVKKSGASCSGSVTSLRKKAKAGGEKGRMYHWCANMKSGRKKK
jgi:hypothetical protein